MSGKTALIFGATGATGRVLLQELLGSASYTLVGEYGRRTTPSDQITVGKDKLRQKVVDFEKLDEAQLNELRWDVVFMCLGSRISGMGAAAAATFEKVDREYVVNAAKAARTTDGSSSQRLVYISGFTPNTEARRLYSRSKAFTERDLAAIGYEETIFFRPGGLTDGQRSERRLGEVIAHSIISLNKSWSDKLLMPIPVLAKALKNAGTLALGMIKPYALEGSTQPFTVIENKSILSIAEK
ncbi:hypothetical protein QCA50_011918 [Cerrena zonata]|uniref:Semialdehyde dehydrogenase NAD-binding domain-containing protein n=1 Tax=Cerrena zonata TaxID=2478898 RepID=A0AAW0G5T6_9APHY